MTSKINLSILRDETPNNTENDAKTYFDRFLCDIVRRYYRITLLMIDLSSIHPGTILKTVFLEPLGITPYRLAKDIGVPQTRISQILAEKRSVSADTALRLSRYFGLDDNFFLVAQASYELSRTRPLIEGDLRHIKPFNPVAETNDES